MFEGRVYNRRQSPRRTEPYNVIIMVLRSTLLIMSALMGQVQAHERQIPQDVCTYTIVMSAKVPPKSRKNLTLWVIEGAQKWRDLCPRAARFAYVRKGPADITFKVGPEQIMFDDAILGYCEDSIVGTRRQGTLSLITEWGHWQTPVAHNPMTRAMMNAVTMHELGHFLGLNHSTDGIMGMFDENHVSPGPNQIEINRVKRFGG